LSRPEIRIEKLIKERIIIIGFKRMSRKTGAYYLKVIQTIFIS